MGLPVNKFICASNDNKVLYDFFKTGVYNKNREFMVTTSPSMDILISSNLERLICKLSSQEKTKELMESLKKNGEYTLEITSSDVVGEYATEKETAEAIKSMFDASGYVMDTHTAVAYAAYEKYKKESGDQTKTIIVSTASPYKFTKDVICALDNKYANMDAFELMKELEKVSAVSIPKPIVGIENRPVLHKNICEKENIKEFVDNYLK